MCRHPDEGRGMIAEVQTLDSIRRSLAARECLEIPSQPGMREAAVAIILRPWTDGLQVLFIERAQKAGDPWSGHMAFPGGHRDPEDADLRAAAVRETAEEIGVALHSANHIAGLDHHRAMPRGRPSDLLIAPHVFALEGDPELRPNHEVNDVVWTELEPLMSGSIHDTQTYPVQGKPTIFNGYRLPAGHFVWGLTYRMLKEFFGTLDATWQPPPEL